MNIFELDNEYIAHTYARFPLQLVSGNGSLVYDQQGKAAEAEAAYRVAVENLTGDTPDEQANRLTALLGHAYILTELQRWAEAYAAWEQVLPLVQEQFDRREEVRTQMRRIKPLIPAAPPAGEPAPAQS